MFRYISIVLLSLSACYSLAEDTTASNTEIKATQPNPQVLIETTAGNITVELFINEAPETVKNFLSYVDSGFYEGTIFHRVIQNFMIQGGGFTKELSKKQTEKPIKNEASEAVKNIRGSIAMARTSAPNSATSQFFINVKDNENLDWRSWNVGYAVFGQVSPNSMGIVDNISFSQTGTIGIYRDVPVDAIEILKISRIQSSSPATLNDIEIDVTIDEIDVNAANE
jgi:peptidyl-prolyl cis-trans isomerase A (cyclophilin A)